VDSEYRDFLYSEFPNFTIVGNNGTKRGFGGTISNAWSYMKGLDPLDYVFHLEDDFLFNGTIDITSMIKILELRSDLAQVVLKRQPWSEPEIAAGGVVEMNPESYKEENVSGYPILTHRVFFSTNPSVYRRSLMLRGWPNEDRSEGMFSIRLFDDDPNTRCAYWGSRNQDPLVTHIGYYRIGNNY
jgi:hypothetical protein